MDILNLLGKFTSRKFILGLLGVSLIPNLPKLGPYVWAGVGLAALYIITEGTADVIRALKQPGFQK